MAANLIHDGMIEAVQAQLAAQAGTCAGLREGMSLGLLHARTDVLSESSSTDMAALAACYGHALAHDRPFYSQNAATALVVIELFLNLNGYALAADDTACFLGISIAGQDELGAEAFAHWIRGHATRQPQAA